MRIRMHQATPHQINYLVAHAENHRESDRGVGTRIPNYAGNLVHCADIQVRLGLSAVREFCEVKGAHVWRSKFQKSPDTKYHFDAPEFAGAEADTEAQALMLCYCVAYFGDETELPEFLCNLR